MKVVLLQDIKGIGIKGDVKIVKDGYARNYLLPNKLASDANSPTALNIQANIQEIKEKKDVQKSKIVEQAEKINNKEIIIESASNVQGKFYGQINNEELSKRFNLSKELAQKINWPKIDKAGEYKVDFSIENKNFSVKIIAKTQIK